MKPNEDPLEPDAVEQATETARLALIEAEASRALVHSRCREVPLVLPHVTGHLAAIATDASGPLRVFVVDGKGSVRHGPKGPLTVDDLVSELRCANPAWEPIAWR